MVRRKESGELLIDGEITEKVKVFRNPLALLFVKKRELG